MSESVRTAERSAEALLTEATDAFVACLDRGEQPDVEEFARRYPAVAEALRHVLPALQQGAIDGAIAGIGPFVHLHFGDAAKYITETNSPAIFIILEVSQKWYDSLPKDLQEIVDRAGATVSKSIEPVALKMYQEQRKAWTDAGGELISLPREEQASMMASLSSVGEDVSKPKPALHEAYQIVTDAAKRTRQAPSQ